MMSPGSADPVRLRSTVFRRGCLVQSVSFFSNRPTKESTGTLSHVSARILPDVPALHNKGYSLYAIFEGKV